MATVEHLRAQADHGDLSGASWPVQMRTCPLVNVCVLAHAREADTLTMLEASDTPALETSPSDDSVLVLRDLIERMQAEIKFERTRNEAGN